MKQKYYNTKTEDLNKKGMVLIAVNAFNNIDSDNDQSLSGSFNKTLKEDFNRARWFLNHDTTKLLGVPIRGYEEGGYLKMIAQFNLKKEIGRDTYEDYKLYAEHGKSLEHSVGVEAIQYEMKGDIRQVSEWKLWEFSTLTHWGANEDTPLLGIKSPDELKFILEQMSNNPKYSDDRKKQIDKNWAKFFLTDNQKQYFETVNKLLNI